MVVNFMSSYKGVQPMSVYSKNPVCCSVRIYVPPRGGVALAPGCMCAWSGMSVCIMGAYVMLSHWFI